jgi:hypothetical protein
MIGTMPMRMPMEMPLALMLVDMKVKAIAHDAPEDVPAKDHKHRSDGQLQRGGEPFGDRDLEDQDADSGRREHPCMPHAPESPNAHRTPDVPMLGDDRRDGCNVIGIQRVSHPGDESENEHEDERHHPHPFCHTRASFLCLQSVRPEPPASA